MFKLYRTRIRMSIQKSKKIEQIFGIYVCFFRIDYAIMNASIRGNINTGGAIYGLW